MKILVVTQYFWPENFRINDLVSEFAKRGHEVTVLTGVPNYPLGDVFPEFKANPQKFSVFEGCKVVRAPMLPRGQGGAKLLLNYLTFAAGATWAALTKLRKQEFDVIFVFEPSPVTVGIPAVLLGRYKKTPVVFWALDLWPETLAALGVVKSPWLLKQVGKLVSFIYNRCDLVLGQSEGFLDNLRKYCKDKSKVRYFPSWAEDVYQEGDVSPAPEIDYRPDLFNIVFAGNIGDAQDMPAVLKAAELLKNEPNIRWLIVGDGRRSDWLAAEIEQRGLTDSVYLLGRFPVDRMPSFYAHADALLVSLKADPVFSLTIPGKVQSYLMTGKPILGMLDGEGAKVIAEAQAGYVCSAGDAQGLAERIKTMATLSIEERCNIGRSGLSFAQTEFGRLMLIDRLEAMLKDVVFTRRAGGL